MDMNAVNGPQEQLETTVDLSIEDMMEEMNNFHLHFPGGTYRQYQKYFPHYSKIHEKIDELIETQEFNLERFNELYPQFSGMQLAFSKAFQIGEEALRKETSQRQKVMNEITLMIYPIFQKMIESGYKQKDITGKEF